MEKLTENQINELKLSFLLSTAVCSIIIIIDILILMYLIHDVEILRVIIYLSVIGILIGHLTFKILKMIFCNIKKLIYLFEIVLHIDKTMISSILNFHLRPVKRFYCFVKI